MRAFRKSDNPPIQRFKSCMRRSGTLTRQRKTSTFGFQGFKCRGLKRVCPDCPSSTDNFARLTLLT